MLSFCCFITLASRSTVLGPTVSLCMVYMYIYIHMIINIYIYIYIINYIYIQLYIYYMSYVMIMYISLCIPGEISSTGWEESVPYKLECMGPLYQKFALVPPPWDFDHLVKSFCQTYGPKCTYKQGGPDSTGLISMGMSMCIYIYIFMCVAYVCYVRFHAQQIAVQKQLCHPMSQLRLFWLCRFENIWRSMCLERFLTLWMATSRFFGTFRTHWLGIALRHRRKTETSIIMAIVFMFTVWRKIFLNGSIYRIF